MSSVLEQLMFNFNPQLSKTTFKWCKNYRYDNYLDNFNCIIETHGLQHYEEINNNWNSLQKTQENDFDKEWLARINGINNYIIIDCRYSEMEWIKNSIMKSRLPKLLGFEEKDIDWQKCNEAGFSSMVKKACELWDSGIHNTKTIAKELKLTRKTIRRYLKQGVKLGWCDYDGQKEFIRNAKKIRKQIICLTTNEIFNFSKDASKKYSVSKTSIASCCNKIYKSSGIHPITGEKLIWMYYDEYIIENQILGWKDDYVNNIINCYKIICLTTGEIFNSIIEARIKYNLKRINTLSNLNDKKYSGKHPETGGELRWMYYKDYLLKIKH